MEADTGEVFEVSFVNDVGGQTYTNLDVEDGVEVSIDVGGKGVLTYDRFSNESSLIATTGNPTIYYINNGSLTYETSLSKETIISNKKK